MIAPAVALVLVVAQMTGAPAPTPPGERPMRMNPNGQGNIRHSMPTCPQGDPMVWLVPKTRTFYAHGSHRFARGTGRYACRSGAVATGAAPGASSASARTSNAR